MCGLFGFVSSKGNININKKDFITLGIFNDSRGGDSVGILTNQQVEYGIEKTKLFSDFYKESELLSLNAPASYLLGHTRKASVGKVVLENAQPVVIYNDNNEIDFVFFHNGTLKNHLALAAKYLTPPYVGVTDSYLMAYMVYFEGFKVFQEYIGAGMFIIVDFRQDRTSPTISFYKGASSTTELVDTMFEERPLYMYATKDGFWYSSMINSLDLISFDDPSAKIVNFIPNTVVSYKDGKLIKSEKLSRAKAMQGTAYGSDNVLLETYKTYQSPVPQSKLPHHTPANNTPNINAQLPTFGEACYFFPKHSHSYYLNKLAFEDGYYYLNGQMAHGPLKITEYGYITEDPGEYIMYFFHGVLLHGKNIYEALNMIQYEFTIEPEDIMHYHSYMLYWKSPMPLEDENGLFYTVTDKFDYVLKHGLYHPILISPSYYYYFNKGSLEERLEVNYGQKISLLNSFKEEARKADKISAEDYYTILIDNISTHETPTHK